MTWMAGRPCGSRPRPPSVKGLRNRDLLVEVDTGDPPFDAAFIVAAAPSDIARELLDARRRRDFLQLLPVAALVDPTQGGTSSSS